MKLLQGTKPLIIGLHYIPQNITPQDFNSYIDLILDYLLGVKDSVLILGDFNIPGICWQDKAVRHGNHYIQQKGLKVLELASLLQCEQHNKSYDESDDTKVLDLALTNVKHCEIESTVNNVEPLVKKDVYHPAFILSINQKCLNNSTVNLSVPIYNFKLCNYLSLYIDLKDMLSKLEMKNDVNYILSKFYDIIFYCFDKNVPKIYEVKNRKFGPVWMSRNLRKLTNRKRKCHNMYKKTGNSKWKEEYISLRTQINNEYRKEEKKYVTELESSLHNNRQYFWSQIKTNRNKNDIVIKENGELLTQKNRTVDVFKKSFENKYKKENQIMKISKQDTCAGPITIPYVTNDDVLQVIRKLKPKAAPGPDQVPCYILKGCRNEFTPVLQQIFNISLQSGTFPKSWKESYIIPISKGGDGTNKDNYRPVTIVNCCSKVFEQIVHNYLAFHLKSVLHPSQHGFIKGKSVETNLIEITDVISNALRDKSQVDVIYIDLSSAFDSVDHRILLKKLLDKGLSPCFVKWFDSYLTCRSFKVKVNNTYSEPGFIYKGVPQGSSLGTLLFTIFIDDLPTLCENLGVQILLYADDIKLYKVIHKSEDSRTLQAALNIVSLWASNNRMVINKNKTKSVTFTRKTQYIVTRYYLNTEPIEQCEYIRDLGVIFDNKLLFNRHIQKTVDSARRVFGCIVTNWYFMSNPEVILYLYKMLVRPKLEFASVIWGSTSNSHKALIEAVQKRVLNFIYYRFKLSHLFYEYNNVCTTFNLQSLMKRREQNDINFLQNILLGKINSEFVLNELYFKVPTHSMRKHNLILTKSSRTGPIGRMVLNYNAVN